MREQMGTSCLATTDDDRHTNLQRVPATRAGWHQRALPRDISGYRFSMQAGLPRPRPWC